MPDSAAKQALDEGTELTPFDRGDFCDLSLFTYERPTHRTAHPTAWDRIMGDEIEVWISAGEQPWLRRHRSGQRVRPDGRCI